MVDRLIMAKWNFLTSHARVLMCIAHDPGARLRDIAASLGITERSAYGIVAGLTAAGYVIKQKDGRRNRYQIQAHLPLREAGGGNLDCSSDLAMPGPSR
jgi:DNA-binding MarR family transcriptional regulator